MPQKILLKNSIPVHIHTSTRAKRVRISVALDGSVLAVHPTRVELGKVLAFLESKIEWV